MWIAGCASHKVTRVAGDCGEPKQCWRCASIRRPPKDLAFRFLRDEGSGVVSIYPRRLSSLFSFLWKSSTVTFGWCRLREDMLRGTIHNVSRGTVWGSTVCGDMSLARKVQLSLSSPGWSGPAGPGAIRGRDRVESDAQEVRSPT
jgi:hypothetical protein